MEIIFNKICVLVTAAFALTLVPGFRRSERSLLSVSDRGTALVVFLLLGLVEDVTVRQTGWFNHRIVVVCAASLLAGLGVGIVVRLFVIWLALTYDGSETSMIAIVLSSAGLFGGFIRGWRPKLAQHPLTGFCLTAAVSLLRDVSIFFYTSSTATQQTLGHLALAPVLQGLGTALMLAVVAQIRERDEQTRAAAAAEIRALQGRMNPHFLFNALNAFAALATAAPRKIPHAVAQLRDFLRASFDQHERALVRLSEELAVVRAYLDIESLRFGNRLKVEQTIDPGALDTLIPPFSLQPLVENAVQHGMQSRSGAGRLRIAVSPVERWLDMRVSDDGQGVPSNQIDKVFFAESQRIHALPLLRRRLQALFGRFFQLKVFSDVGQGTTIWVRIPLKMRSEVEGKSSQKITAVAD
jgi:LytS/YehU family sensor histidine kinase